MVERIRERSYHALIERGLKLTKPRQAVLDFLLDHPHSQFQPEEIFSRLNQFSPGLISRPTVYRTLDLLVDSAIVTRTIVNSNCFRYQLAEEEHHACHYHLVDVGTGQSVSFNADPELRRVLKQICQERGFSEQYHVLKVYGEFKRKRRSKGGAATPSVNGGAPSADTAAAASFGNEMGQV
jgi:Fe2+ or Zn2+ uptake regulation protein